MLNLFKSHRSIPYCSSDLWVGNSKHEASTNNDSRVDFSFMGQHILNSVLDDLLASHRLGEAKLILFVGVR